MIASNGTQEPRRIHDFPFKHDSCLLSLTSLLFEDLDSLSPVLGWPGSCPLAWTFSLGKELINLWFIFFFNSFFFFLFLQCVGFCHTITWNWKSLSRVQLFSTHGLYSPWNSPGQNTGVGSHSLLQGIFPTQGSNPCLLHCRRILYQLSHKGSPTVMWVSHDYTCITSLPSPHMFVLRKSL